MVKVRNLSVRASVLVAEWIHCNAIVLAKLERFDWELTARTKVAEKYYSLINEKILSDNYARQKEVAFSCVHVDSKCKSAYGQFSIICEER